MSPILPPATAASMPLIKALLGGVDQPLCFGRNLSNRKSGGVIAVVSAKLGTKVDRDNVALLKDTVFAGDSVDNLVVYRDTSGGRIACIVQEIRFSALTDNIIVSYFIYLPRGDARSDRLAGDFQGSGRS